MRIAALLVLLAVAVSADTRAGERIVGGSVTTINAYPFAASILHGPSLLSYYQYCGGAILNNRSILSAAHCFVDRATNQFRVRVGSTWANSGGTVYNTAQIIININYNRWTLDSDIAILRTATNIAFIANTVQAGYIAGSNYNLLDNQIVYGIGWGRIAYNGAQSEQLRQVQVWSVNQATCRLRFLEVGWNVTDNMLCAGWLDVGGRAQCVYDEGSPLLHNNTIVGVYSFGYQCGLARYPQVNTRVSRFTSWIQTNA